MRGYPDLTEPLSGSTSARDVLSKALRRLLDDLRHLPIELAPPGDARASWSAARKEVARALEDRGRAGAVFAALRLPTVGALVRVLRTRAPGDADAGRIVVELAATLGVELGRLGALVEPLRLSALPPRVLSLGGRFALAVPEGTRALSIDADGLALEREGAEPIPVRWGHEGEPLQRPYHPIADHAVLALDDNNPLSMFEAHPDKAGNAIDLGGRPVEAWTDALTDAFARVDRYLPELARDMALYAEQIVPVGFDPEKHLSASYQEAIGTVYMTLHPDPMTMTEALIHELAHNRLNAMLELDPLLENAFAPLFKSPVRPDPRPLHGVLLAVHAFLPVARLYERMRETDDPLASTPGFARRFRDILDKNHEGATVVVAHGVPTEAGRALLDEIARLDGSFAALR